MAALLIETTDSKNLKLIAELAKQLGGKVKSISLTEMEDIVLGEMMAEAKTNEYISKEDLFKSLDANS